MVYRVRLEGLADIPLGLHGVQDQLKAIELSGLC